MEPLRTSSTWSSAPTDPRRVEPKLRRKYDVHGPRYTSYPPANHFAPIDRDELFGRWRSRNGIDPDPGLSLYVHIPFCESRCLYCGCHSFICQDRSVAGTYVRAVLTEMDLAAQVVDPVRPVRQVALGGGTPNFLPVGTLRALLAGIHARWQIRPDAERSCEIDPRSVTEEQLDVLLSRGFNRFSLGVQDFSPTVLELVSRRQSGLAVEHVVDYLRARGCQELNFDLIYGLPGQSLETAQLTVRRLLDLGPTRVALYSYAHVPWIRPHQEALEERGLPSPELKAEMFWFVADALLAAGYRSIGMDHFALPSDPLYAALEDRTLRRSFMGYTIGRGLDVLGFGVSAISSVGASYSQNDKDLEPYHQAVAGRSLPIVRGHLLSPDDELRRELLLELFCTFHADLSSLSKRFGLDAATYLADDLARLAPMIDDGLVSWTEQEILVSPQGRFFIRNICMTFDRYLERDGLERRYSRTV